MKKIIRLMAALSALVIMAGLASCSEEKIEYEESEVVDAAKALIEASYEINEIYFGKGLPISEEDSEAAKEFYAGLDLDMAAVDFLPVTEEAPYHSIDEIKKATAKVYSKEYCEMLYERAFTGVSSENGSSAALARYIEDSKGVLTARLDIADTCIPLDRTYDPESIKVTETEPKKAKISVDSFVKGEKDENLTFTLVLEEDGWRLDTPTY